MLKNLLKRIAAWIEREKTIWLGVDLDSLYALRDQLQSLIESGIATRADLVELRAVKRKIRAREKLYLTRVQS